jgi:hypothetical protein
VSTLLLGTESLQVSHECPDRLYQPTCTQLGENKELKANLQLLSRVKAIYIPAIGSRSSKLETFKPAFSFIKSKCPEHRQCGTKYQYLYIFVPSQSVVIPSIFLVRETKALHASDVCALQTRVRRRQAWSSGMYISIKQDDINLRTVRRLCSLS